MRQVRQPRHLHAGRIAPVIPGEHADGMEPEARLCDLDGGAIKVVPEQVPHQYPWNQVPRDRRASLAPRGTLHADDIKQFCMQRLVGGIVPPRVSGGRVPSRREMCFLERGDRGDDSAVGIPQCLECRGEERAAPARGVENGQGREPRQQGKDGCPFMLPDPLLRQDRGDAGHEAPEALTQRRPDDVSRDVSRRVKNAMFLPRRAVATGTRAREDGFVCLPNDTLVYFREIELQDSFSFTSSVIDAENILNGIMGLFECSKGCIINALDKRSPVLHGSEDASARNPREPRIDEVQDPVEPPFFRPRCPLLGNVHPRGLYCPVADDGQVIQGLHEDELVDQAHDYCYQQRARDSRFIVDVQEPRYPRPE